MSDWWAVAFAVALLAANAFFVGAEFALIAARRDRLEALEANGKKRARTVIRASENLSLMLAGSQLGITICSILLGRIGEPAVAHLIEKPLHLVHVPASLLHPIAFAIALTIVVILHILVGEMVPKNIALAGPEAAAMLLVPVHLLFIKLMIPVIWFYNQLANLTLRMFRVEPKDELASTVDESELAQMIAESRELGMLDAEESARITRALENVERTVEEVMIPLADVRSIPAVTDPATSDPAGPTAGVRRSDVEEAVRATGFSRFPVVDASGAYAGYLHLKDVLPAILDRQSPPGTLVGIDLVRPLPVVQRDLKLDEATVVLRRATAHLAEVVDESGTTIGLLALADVAEAFVGNLPDATHTI